MFFPVTYSSLDGVTDFELALDLLVRSQDVLGRADHPPDEPGRHRQGVRRRRGQGQRRAAGGGAAVRLGMHLPQFGRSASPRTLVDIAVRAEQMGFSDVWASDHIAVPTTMTGTPSFFPEPVPLLSLAAGHTDRVGLGTSVIIAAYRNPMQFAKQWATLDWLAPDRTILGVGRRLAGRGVRGLRSRPGPQRPAARRLHRRLAGALGRRHRVRQRVLHLPRRPGPAAARTPIPVWVGGSSAGAIRRAAANDGWHPTWAPIEVFRRHLDTLHAEIDRLGRSRADVTVSMHLEVRIGEQLPAGVLVAGRRRLRRAGRGRRHPRRPAQHPARLRGAGRGTHPADTAVPVAGGMGRAAGRASRACRRKWRARERSVRRRRNRRRRRRVGVRVPAGRAGAAGRPAGEAGPPGRPGHGAPLQGPPARARLAPGRGSRATA